MSHFFAYLFRMKLIERWGLMRHSYSENIQEHSLRVSLIAHMLCVIRNSIYGGNLNPDRAASLAMYHDSSEVLTGDLPAPIKYFNPEIRDAYKNIEASARDRLIELIPVDLREEYRSLIDPKADDPHTQIVKAADKLCAYIKCVEELAAGNREFARAESSLKETIDQMKLPEVDYFLETFVPSLALSIDELGDVTPNEAHAHRDMG